VTSKINQPTLHHVNLKTTRLQEMIDWYGTVVGSKPNFQFPGGAWLTNDGANHRIALLTSSKMSDDPDKLVHTGMHHLAFEYGNFNDLLDTYSRLRELRVGYDDASHFGREYKRHSARPQYARSKYTISRRGTGRQSDKHTSRFVRRAAP